MVLSLAAIFSATPAALAQRGPLQGGGMTERPGMAPALKDVGIDQRLNEQIPLDLLFKDESGRDVTLGDCAGGKPVVLALVYYECPMLCNEVLNGLVGSLKAISFDAGDQFNVIAVSFNPRETSELARAKKESYLARYGRDGTEAGWHFLTGESDSIDALTRAAGFRYSFDPATNQYAHASAIMVVTPQGKLSHYFYGIDYAPRDLRLALVEASAGKVGTPVDQVLLYCYHYDPTTGKYGAAVMNLLRLGGFATLAGIAVLVMIMRRRNRNRGQTDNAGAPALYSFVPIALIQIPFLPERASTFAGEVDDLYLFLVAVSVFFSVLISAAIIYFAIRYRRRSEMEVGSGLHGSIKLELIWTVIPFVIAMGIFVWGARVYFSITRPPSEALEIYGIGKQWMWKFQHPDGQREVNELHVPIGRNVKVTIATEDVIHSFYVPAFRVKADVVPGRLTTVWFKATKAGRYHLFCAEYCGNQHSGMIGWVNVMEPTDYQAWLTGGATEGTMAQSGEKLFTQFACNNCHRKEPGGRGPVLEGVFGREVLLDSGRTIVADESYVRESIFNPQAKVVAGYNPVMPTFKGLVSEEQLLQLIAYIKSLTPQKPGASGEQAGPAPAAPANANRAQRQNRTR